MWNKRIFQFVRVIKCVPTRSGLQHSGPQFRVVALSAVLHICLAVGGESCYLVSFSWVESGKGQPGHGCADCSSLLNSQGSVCGECEMALGWVAEGWSLLGWSRALLGSVLQHLTVLTRQSHPTAVAHFFVSTDFVLRTWGRELYLEMLTVECRAFDAMQRCSFIQLERSYQRFTAFYASRHSGRKLTWLYQLSKGELVTNCFKNRYTLQVKSSFNVCVGGYFSTKW